MIIFTKYSNERAPQFCIRTDILEKDGERWVRKSPASPKAGAHVQGIRRRQEALSADLAETPLSVNDCTLRDGAAWFPFLEGETLEERLDALLAKGKTGELKGEIRRYFAMFAEGGQPFVETDGFREVFGSVRFERPPLCRAVSDIDMIFSNALARGAGFSLIDYEWTFDFPIPVKYLQYRCLYYYVLGNRERDGLKREGLFAEFGISREEEAEFGRMERSFQSWMRGDCTPVWMLYDEISPGAISVKPLVDRESAARRQAAVEVYFDDGRGYGAWSMRRFPGVRDEAGRVALKLLLPEGTKELRLDPCGHRCVVRLERLRQGGGKLRCRSNGSRADNGDFLFDTEDAQFYITPRAESREPVEIRFRCEPMEGLSREVILNQHGKLRWMEQTKVWRLYRKLRRGDVG